MKEKEILNVIKDDISEKTPNILSKIDLKNISIEEKPQTKEKTTFNPFKRFPIALVMGVFVLALVIFSIAYKPENIPPNTLTKVSVTEKDKIVVGYAITGINLVGNYSYEVQTLNYNKLTSNIKKQNQTQISYQFIDEFHKYFYFVEEYLKFYDVEIEIYINEENDYDYKMIVKVEKLFNTLDEYILYYDEKREIDDDEEEKEMSGILIYQNKTYNFKSEEENENGESEIKVIIYEDNYNNRVEIEKEIEIDEYQYEYTVYKDNKKYEVVELEVEDEKIELVIEKEDVEHEYIIVKTNNNYFVINYDDDYRFNLFIDLNKKHYVYEYLNEEIIKK